MLSFFLLVGSVQAYGSRFAVHASGARISAPKMQMQFDPDMMPNCGTAPAYMGDNTPGRVAMLSSPAQGNVAPPNNGMAFDPETMPNCGTAPAYMGDNLPSRVAMLNNRA